MKRGQKRTFTRATSAQSNALGFMLVLSILLSASSVYLGTQIPEWTKDYEFEHTSKVHQDFADLGSTIDLALVSEDPTASNSIAIGMAPECVQLANIFATGGTLMFDPDSESFECIASMPVSSLPASVDRWWNSTPANFSDYDAFHVTSSDTGAELALIQREDKTFKSGGEVYVAGEYFYDNFTVTNNTKLITTFLTIHAMNITIDAGSEINADGRGMAGGKKDENGLGSPGGGLNSGNYSAGGGGAGYGGDGGKGGKSLCDRYDSGCGCGGGGLGGLAYGDGTSFAVEAGSGGAGGSSGRKLGTGGIQYDGGKGGNGGGSIHLDAKTVTIAGTLSVDGLDGKEGSRAPDSAGGGGGGGSGGTILIQGWNVSIMSTGKLNARGGAGGVGGSAWNSYSIPENNGGGGGGGAGGRIKIFYADSLIVPDGFSNHVNVSAGTGGAGGPIKWSGPYYSGLPGENGTQGTNKSVQKDYTSTLGHCSPGYLISNPTVCADNEMIQYISMSWTENTPPPPGTDIAFKVRTAITANMSDALPWEECPELTPERQIGDLYSVSHGQRYIQWRADFSTFDRSRTPTLKSVNLYYKYDLIPTLVNTSGCIRFASQYLYLPNFELRYASGATVRHQADGTDFIAFSPPITVSKDADNSISLMVSTLTLTGDDEVISGASVASVRAAYVDAALAKKGLSYANITFAITSNYCTAWENWFNATCEAAGLHYGNDSGQYSFEKSGNTLYVEFHGDDMKPVKLWLKNLRAGIDLL